MEKITNEQVAKGLYLLMINTHCTPVGKYKNGVKKIVQGKNQVGHYVNIVMEDGQVIRYYAEVRK